MANSPGRFETGMGKSEPPPAIEYPKSQDPDQPPKTVDIFELAQQGISVIPIKTDGSKSPPIRWTLYQSQIARPDELSHWQDQRYGFAVVCGKISGNLEVIDVDDPNLLEAWKELVAGEVGGDLVNRLVIVQTPDGYHVYYRCQEGIEGSQKLAQRKGADSLVTLIETKGEGGYVILPSSPPECHPDNLPYNLIRSNFAKIPNVTAENRASFHNCARALSEYFSPKRTVSEPSDSSNGNLPGDHFNREAKWKNILEPKGWEKIDSRRDGDIEVEYWRRPGKLSGSPSATVNIGGSNLLYVFSSNADPFEPENAYNPFAAYTFLNHDENFAKSAADLAEQGFGMKSDSNLGYSVEDFLNLPIREKETLVEDLLKKRDLVTLAGRRRHGKTTFLVNFCVALATRSQFLAYEIPKPRRSLMLLLEDDPGELQEKFRRITTDGDLEGRVHILTREDFLDSAIPIDIEKTSFTKAVERVAKKHTPDLIVIDNLAHVIGAKYNEADLIHTLMNRVYGWAKTFDAAVVLAAHPRKQDPRNLVHLDKKPEEFFEEVMGSSHFINSTGSLWALERRDDLGYAIFLGGRQRGDGQQSYSVIHKRDDDWFSLLPGAMHSLSLVNHTQVRKDAWELLPNPPQTFGYREGEEMVKSAMTSSSSYHAWMKDLRRHNLVVKVKGKLQRNAEIPEG